jgi:hypothetical protein
MGNLSARIRVQNSTEKPRIVWVKPWAEDFTLLAGEELELSLAAPLTTVVLRRRVAREHAGLS